MVPKQGSWNYNYMHASHNFACKNDPRLANVEQLLKYIEPHISSLLSVFLADHKDV